MRTKAMAQLLIAALVVVFALEGAVRAVEPRFPEPLRWNSAEAQVRIDDVEGFAGSIETFFVGTSMVMQGVDPEAITETSGALAYNAGLPALIPTETEVWIEELLERSTPGVIVWGLSSLDFNANRRTAAGTVKNSLAAKDGLIGDLDRWASDSFALVRQRTNLRQPRALLDALTGRSSESALARAEAETSEFGQRTQQTAAVTPHERRRIADQVLTGWAWSEEQADAVRRVAERLRSEGIQLVIVEMPVPERYIELHPGGWSDFDESRDRIARLAADLDIPVIDGVSGLTDNDLFLDYTHLAEDGASELSKRIARALHELGL